MSLTEGLVMEEQSSRCSNISQHSSRKPLKIRGSSISNRRPLINWKAEHVAAAHFAVDFQAPCSSWDSASLETFLKTSGQGLRLLPYVDETDDVEEFATQITEAAFPCDFVWASFISPFFYASLLHAGFVPISQRVYIHRIVSTSNDNRRIGTNNYESRSNHDSQTALCTCTRRSGNSGDGSGVQGRSSNGNCDSSSESFSDQPRCSSVSSTDSFSDQPSCSSISKCSSSNSPEESSTKGLLLRKSAKLGTTADEGIVDGEEAFERFHKQIILDKKEKKYLLQPKLHQERCCFLFEKGLPHVSRNTRKQAKHFFFSVDRSFEGVLRGCINQHGESWLWPPVRLALYALFLRQQQQLKKERIITKGSSTGSFPVDLIDALSVHSVEVWVQNDGAANPTTVPEFDKAPPHPNLEQQTGTVATAATAASESGKQQSAHQKSHTGTQKVVALSSKLPVDISHSLLLHAQEGAGSQQPFQQQGLQANNRDEPQEQQQLHAHALRFKAQRQEPSGLLQGQLSLGGCVGEASSSSSGFFVEAVFGACAALACRSAVRSAEQCDSRALHASSGSLSQVNNNTISSSRRLLSFREANNGSNSTCSTDKQKKRRSPRRPRESVSGTSGLSGASVSVLDKSESFSGWESADECLRRAMCIVNEPSSDWPMLATAGRRRLERGRSLSRRIVDAPTTTATAPAAVAANEAADEKSTEGAQNNCSCSFNRRSLRLCAGEIGVLIGRVYVSLTGFADVSHAGNVQMAALGLFLKLFCNVSVWDLGMELEYKRQMGAELLKRRDFLRLFREERKKNSVDFVKAFKAAENAFCHCMHKNCGNCGSSCLHLPSQVQQTSGEKSKCSVKQPHLQQRMQQRELEQQEQKEIKQTKQQMHVTKEGGTRRQAARHSCEALNNKSTSCSGCKERYITSCMPRQQLQHGENGEKARDCFLLNEQDTQCFCGVICCEKFIELYRHEQRHQCNVQVSQLARQVVTPENKAASAP